MRRQRALLLALLFVPSLALAQPAGDEHPRRRPAPTTPEAPDLSERVVHATVSFQLGGPHPRGRGVVLADGRIVTALELLGGQTEVVLRYPNGRTGQANVVATDPVWGLALLQPRTGAWNAGVATGPGRRASVARWTAGDPFRQVVGALARRRTFVGLGDTLLRDAWELHPVAGFDALGSGITDVRGELVGVIVPPAVGVPAGAASSPFGAPAYVIEDMQRRAGNTARAWTGLGARALRPAELRDGVPEGLRITQITPNGPAARVGLQAGAQGDLLIEANGRPLRTTADFAAVLSDRHPGDPIELRVWNSTSGLRGVTLTAAPYPAIGP